MNVRTSSSKKDEESVILDGEIINNDVDSDGEEYANDETIGYGDSFDDIQLDVDSPAKSVN